MARRTGLTGSESRSPSPARLSHVIGNHVTGAAWQSCHNDSPEIVIQEIDALVGKAMEHLLAGRNCRGHGLARLIIRLPLVSA